MPRNKLDDLNNHLFEMLERLNDDELKGEDLHNEISRAKAIAHVSSAITQNAALALRAAELHAEYSGKAPLPLPELLAYKADEKRNH